jgi:alkylation response protein AidB-like acyl-CoA dehydrogenase
VQLGLSDEQEQLVAAFEAFFSKEAPSSMVRQAEPLGFDAELWAKLGELGGPMMGIPEADGGGGASLLDVVLLAEQFGASLAPVPFVESAVTARLLAAAGAPARELLEPMAAAPPSIGALALRPAVDGTVRLVPAGAVADVVVGLDGDELVAAVSPPSGQAPANLGTGPIADRSLRSGSRHPLASGAAASAAYAVALDEWRVLTAGALVGLATAALRVGVAYAKSRQQFGVPIGSFQSIARDLADAATAVDGARLLAREAAWAAVDAPDEFASLASMAFLFASRTAQQASGVGLHVHGGYGYMLEYDIGLYYRRAKAWPLVAGDPRRGVQHLADTLFGPVGEG